MLYELGARGYHRPYAVAYLTKEPGLLPAVLPTLAPAIARVVAALKRCNRKLFLREMSQVPPSSASSVIQKDASWLQALDTLRNVETQAVSSYYELYYENGLSLPSHKQPSRAERIHLKTRKIFRDLELTHALLRKVGPMPPIAHSQASSFEALKNGKEDKSSGFPLCGDHCVSIEDWMEKVLETRDPSVPVHLKPLAGLCPCLHQV